MRSYLLYGLSAQPLDELLQRLSRALGANLTAHESSYRGVYFRSGSTGDEHFLLQPNFLEHEDEWIDEDHRDYPFLFYVNETARPDEIDLLLQEEIPSIVRLKREVL